ncbi:unnamed protein product [Durusdinium trenchii]|uniref:Cilia- and flagella-associated protein 157 n=1 Tax=Durusdinium trenchii TaxID=1381693 RepID=A0ABP0MV06_9DINO
MKYAQQKRGGRTAIFAGTCADEPVPTVCFDLSDSAGRELPPTSQSTPMSFSLSAPSLEEHYGALLQREEQAHQRTEEKLRMAQEQMRRMQDDLQKRELEFEEEKKELMDMIDEKEEILAWEQSQLEQRVQQERELAKAENVRLRERVKKLNMIQNNLLKQVSMLMTEREELKRLERRKSPRGKTSSLTSSCTSLGAPGMSFDRMAELNAFVKNGAHKNGDAKVQEPFEEMLREVEAGAQDSPERSVSESVRSRNSQELLRQIRQQTCCYAATRAAVSPRPVSPGLRRRDPGIPSYADVMALPLKESGCGSPEKQDDLMQSFVQHFAAYTRQNDASPAS